MRRRLLILLAGFAPACARAPDAEPPPGILLVSLDTLRGDRLGFGGYERDTTPNLDALATESLVFSRAIATSCWTLTSHMGILTGLYPEQHGVVANEAALNPSIPLLAERLKAAGYVTIALFEPGWIDARHGFDRGFDVFRPHANAEEAGVHLSEELDKLDGDRPVFLFLHLFDIHCDPVLADVGTFYDPPPPYDRMFRADAPDVLRNIDFKKALAEPGSLTADQLDALEATYDGGIRYIDAKLGGWIADWRGLLDRSVLFVTADHGEALGRRDGELDQHGGMYQDALHIPLLVRFPDGRRAGVRRDDPVNQVDLAPTILELARLPRDPHLPGYSLLSERPKASVMPAMLANDYALLEWPWKVLGRGDEVVLFQLEEDPDERRPLPLSDARARAAYDRMYTDFKKERSAVTLRDAPPGTAGPMDKETRAKLAAMGYADELGDE
jgi:arylsulfatase